MNKYIKKILTDKANKHNKNSESTNTKASTNVKKQNQEDYV